MKNDSPVPSIKDFRQTIDDLGKNRNSLLIKTLYLTSSRCSEFLTKQCPSDVGKSRPLGRSVTYEMKKIIVPNIQYKGKEELNRKNSLKRFIGTGKKRPHDDMIDILLLKVPVLKQRGMYNPEKPKPQKFKMVALPCEPDFDNWTYDLLQWIVKHDSLSFDLTRQTVYKIVKKLLGYHTHWLRDIRVTHLVNSYKFTGEQVSLVTGWTLQKSYGFLGQPVSDKMSIYLHSTWQNYIGKLLIPMDTIKADIITLQPIYA